MQLPLRNQQIRDLFQNVSFSTGGAGGNENNAGSAGVLCRKAERKSGIYIAKAVERPHGTPPVVCHFRIPEESHGKPLPSFGIRSPCLGTWRHWNVKN